MSLRGRHPGCRDLKDQEKATPFAAQMAAEDCVKKAKEHGVRKVQVYVKGPGSGRESRLTFVAGRRVDHILDSRCNADSAQWMSASQET